ncbi:MAG: T9SS C-terminal target domain-containing protein, partial [Calditrichaeota bacterium]
ELGYIVTWPEKIQDNEAVDRLRGAVDFWFLDDQMQTLAMIDSLHLFGLDRALISLSGSWYAPKDKGELIDYINENGYLSSRYDIYTDVWPPDHPETPWYRTEGYPQDVIVNQDGSLRKGWLAYLQGNVPFQGYYTCSQTHELYAEKWISEELASQPYNCRFIDVELASSLTECYSPVHPITRKDDAHYRTRLLQTVKSDFNLVTGSEEAHDWAFPTVDFGEGTMTMRPQDNAGYDWANPITNPEADYARYNIEPDVRLPLHGLVYHDVHVPTWYTGDGQSKVPQFWEDKDLWNILYASMPLFAPPDRGYWQKNKEKYLTSYFLACSVFRECGFEPMIDHQFIDGRHEVQMTEFANGWKVVANFSDAPIAWNEFMLAPKGCYAGNGRDVVYKIMNADNPTAVCCLADRLFINPFGQAFEGYGIRTTGSLVLQKKADRLELALIGNQKEFEINPQKLPWQMESVRIYTHDNAEIKPEVRTDGWLRIIKQKRMPFYQIKGIFTTVEESQLDHPREYRLAVYPNPLNGRSRIIFSAPTSAPVTLRLYNILGKEIETLFSGRLSAREQSLSLNSDGLATGIYFLDFAAADQRLTQKMMVIK